MKNQNFLDQFFLTDQGVVIDLVEAINPKKEDVVLEIGAGSGVVTEEIAKRVKKVIAVEIDKNFQKDLEKLPSNVQTIYNDILKNISKIKFNKIVASLPSSIIEPLMQKLIKLNFKTASFLVPLIFVKKLAENPNYNFYLQTELIRKIEKDCFNPQPKTNWALVKITKMADPVETKDWIRFIEQYIYNHPEAKLKNCLMEAIIKTFSFQGKMMTKNQARTMIKKVIISESLLEGKPLVKNKTTIKSALQVLFPENPPLP